MKKRKLALWSCGGIVVLFLLCLAFGLILEATPSCKATSTARAIGQPSKVADLPLPWTIGLKAKGAI